MKNFTAPNRCSAPPPAPAAHRSSLPARPASTAPNPQPPRAPPAAAAAPRPCASAKAGFAATPQELSAQLPGTQTTRL
ncbi:hypothetical protein AYI70_g11653 [Smittium culicis]|uniref:Uncharacterized protein n=1 Tax=Smittium culicis TaxID=133412 RepID=A0A1R1X0W3_9FUNG|nr:hypothetical protein AYI70_g11653 [Smittium culicis]